MANPKLNVDVTGNTKPLERQLNKVKSKGVDLNLNSKNFSAPLGKIKGELGEFDKSLAASNARVLAFGASAGAIFAIEKALSETVKATIAVEKSLAEVNVILGTSEKKLAGFGNTLFDIAKKTGRSFQDVSLAAGELARQGLAMEDTLKRTSDAMILARLSGLGVEESVNAITAALNGFRNAALNSTAVVDKLIAVDQAFAVSGADLAEALRRVGSTAEGAGVSLDELLGIVTAAQQITARGGSVIGNSFKTIFTRIQRPRVLEALDELGVKTKNAAGASLAATTILKNLASTFDRLGEAQQAQIAELVGGVFQINVLKASLSDLGSQYSVFTSATEIASRASGESAKRNAELNKTLSAGLNETLQNLTKLAAGVGKLTLEPAIRQVLGFVNAITTKLSGEDGGAEEAGKGIAQTLLGGIGKFLSGPGLALAAVALFQLFNNLRKFAVDAFNTFTGLNASFKQQQQLQQGILSILQQNPKVLAQIQRGEISVDQAAQSILGTYKNLNAELLSANSLATSLAQKMSKGGARVGNIGPTQTIKANARGYIPNFADQGEVAAMAMSGMYTKSQVANPRTRRGKVFDGKGGSFMASYNGYEKKRDVIGPNGRKGTVIASPAMQKALAFGFIPNFAGLRTGAGRPGIGKFNEMSATGKGDFINSATSTSAFSKVLASKKLSEGDRLAIQRKSEELDDTKKEMPINVKKQIGIIGTRFGGDLTMSTNQAESRNFLQQNGIPVDADGPVKRAVFKGIEKARPINLAGDDKVDSKISSSLVQPIAEAVSSVAQTLFHPNEKQLPDTEAVNRYLQSPAGKEKLALTAGNIFEDAINAGISLSDKETGARWDYTKDDFDGKQGMLKALLGPAGNEFANIPVSDAKLTYPPKGGEAGMREKIFSKMTPPSVHQEIKRVFAARGYIPNFVGGALGDAIGRENRANVTKSAIRIGSDRRLASGANPFGLAVTNTRDEPRGIKDVFAGGYVPNFAARMAEKIDAGTAAPLVPKSLVNDVSAAKKMNAEATNSNSNAIKQNSAATKTSTGGSEKLFGMMMLASVATSVFASAGEDAGPAMQKFSAGVNAATNGAMVLTTAMTTLTGPFGIALGAVAGLTTALYSYFGSVKNASPAQMAANDALKQNAVRLKEQGDTIQQTQQALSTYSDSLKGGDARQLVAAQEKYKETLLALEPALRQQVMTAATNEDRQELLGKAASRTAKASRSAGAASEAQKELIARIEKNAKEKTQGAILKGGLVAVGLLGIIKGAQLLSNRLEMASSGAQRAQSTAEVTAIQSNAATTQAALAQQTATLSQVIRTSGMGGKVGKIGRASGPVAASAMGGARAGATGLATGGAGAAATGAATTGLLAFGGAIVAGTAAIVGVVDLFHVLRGEGSAFTAILSGRKAAEKMQSKYNDPDAKAGDIQRSKKTDRQMTADAQALLDQLENAGAFDKGREQEARRAGVNVEDLTADQKASADRKVLSGIKKASTSRGDAEGQMIDQFENLGASALEAGAFIEGSGAQAMALAGRMEELRKKSNGATAEIERLQVAIDASAAAEAAFAAALETANMQANGAAELFRAMAKGIAAARQDTQQFNREFSLEALKGGSKLAAQFQTSFQQTAQQGSIKKLEINEKAAQKSTKLRDKGSQAMFQALSKQESVAKLMEKVDKGGAEVSQSEQVLVNALRNLPNSLSGGGAGVMMQGFSTLMNQASRPGGALEGEKVGIDGLGLEKVLGEQLNAMAEAERTRQQQLAMADLQTRLAQEQNRIDQQSKFGGGIKAFLDPAIADKMEDGFNTSVSDFVTASNRGDGVKTGQAAGNLLGNLNEFMGADLMGPAADKLKDMVQGGLEQSLRGRAMARADVLDQAAAQTGDSSLSELADTLRNQNFAEIAATQTALEFKRQKMPDNIASMLGIQQKLESLQQSDVAANVRTSTATASMANYLVGGGFAGAVAGIASKMPPAIVPGLGATNTLLQQGANAMVAVARVIAGTEGTKQAGEEAVKGAEKRRNETIALNDALKSDRFNSQGVDNTQRIAEHIVSIGEEAAKELEAIEKLTPRQRSRIDPAYLEKLKSQQALAEGISSGRNIDASTYTPEQLQSLGPIVGDALKEIMARGFEGTGIKDRSLGSNEQLGTGVRASGFLAALYGRKGGSNAFGTEESRREEARQSAMAMKENLNRRILAQGESGATDAMLADMAAINQMLKMLSEGTFEEFIRGKDRPDNLTEGLLGEAGFSASTPINITIVNEDGTVKKVEELTTKLNFVNKALGAGKIGAPVTPMAKTQPIPRSRPRGSI